MRRLIAVITLLCALLLPASALAGGGGDAVLRDCVQHGNLTKTYTQAQYQDALDNMPADLQEYSNCTEVISQAKRSAAAKSHTPGGGKSGTTGTPGSGGSGSGGSGGGGAGAPSSSGGGAPSSGGGSGSSPAGGTQASPGSGATRLQDQAGGSAAGAGSTGQGAVVRPLTARDLRAASVAPAKRGLGSLPTPLIVVLVLLALLALVMLGLTARRRLPELAHAPLMRRVLARRDA